MSASFGRVAYIEVSNQYSFEQLAKLKLDDPSSDFRKNLTWRRFSGLDIKFDITRPIFSLMSEAKISILGLSMDNIELLSSWGGDATAWKRSVLIRVYAGYGDSDSDAHLIFEGNIINAMPTMPPNVWLEIQARTLYVETNMSMTKDVKDAANAIGTLPFGEYIDRFCVLVGMNANVVNLPKDDIDKPITLPTYATPTTIQQVLGDFSKLCRSMNTMFYISWEGSDNGAPTIVFDYLVHPKDYTPSKSICISVNKSTGMIGIPKMKFNQIEVTCLLKDDVMSSLLYYVDVESRFAMPGMYNWKGDRTEDLYHALFRIINIRYHGHLRGTEWYVTYTALKDFNKGDM